MRIVQVANFYTPTSGGLKIVVEETGRGFLEAGHERMLIVPGTAESVEQTSSGQRVVMPSLRLPGFGNYRLLVSRRRIRELLAAQPPDILEVSDKFSLPWLARWSRRRGVPLVLFSHERLDAVLRPRLPRWFPLRATADVVNRRLSRLADQVVVTSSFSSAEFERVGAVNLRRVRLGVDLDTFRPAAEQPAGEDRAGPVAIPGQSPTAWPPGGEPAAGAPAGSRPVRLVTVSRLSKEKSPGQAVETVRELHRQGVPATLVMIGDGPQLERLRKQAEGLPVTFLRHISDRRELADLVAAADVALSPSPAETFGLATLEALACGTPVVVPADGAARELLDAPGSGAVSDGTAAGMAEAIRHLMAVPEHERRKAARAAAERYPWSATVAGLLSAYQEIGLRREASGSLPGQRRPPR
jgi:alpha-1,6-mannosyltransferase